MRAAILFLAVVVCVRALSHHKHGHKQEKAGPLTVTPLGSISGSWMQSRRGRSFQAYRGVRYAQPPVGTLRFQPPQPIPRYEGVVDASEEGPACPLPVDIPYYVDEDCLRLNVYTPRTNSTKLPVIFFIHAGGFYSMTGRSDLAGPHYLMDKDVVLVTINYRLASLGFLSTGDELAPGNNGLKDQVQALRWVRQNIAAFGGDPDNVTIAGCSAGSISVMLHMISPMSKGLFHRAIGMSGSPTSKVPSLLHMRELAARQARLVRCADHSSAAIIDCLRNKPWKEIADSLPGFFEFGYDPIGVWLPVVEPDFGQERFLPVEPMDAIRENRMHAVPFIVGQTTDEFFWNAFTILKNATLLKKMSTEWEQVAPISFMLPRENSKDKVNKLKEVYLGNKQLENNAESAKGLGRLYGDSIIGFPVHRMANLMCRHSPQPVYYYEFAYIGTHSHYEDPITKKPTGAAHHDDLIYLFSLSYRFPAVGTTGPDSDMVDTMTDMWYNFAKYGDPNPNSSDAIVSPSALSKLSWPPMTASDRNYLRIDKQLTVKKNMFEDRFKIWEELYPIKY